MCECLVNCLANEEAHNISCSCSFPLFWKVGTKYHFLLKRLKLPSNARHSSAVTYASNAQLLIILLGAVYCTLLICYHLVCITYGFPSFMYVARLHDSFTHLSNAQYVTQKVQNNVWVWPITYHLSRFPICAIPVVFWSHDTSPDWDTLTPSCKQ